MVKNCSKCNRHGMDYDPRCKTWICLYMDCNHFENEKVHKPRLVIEIKAGALFAAFCDTDIELILVDHDEFEGGASSAVVIPDSLVDMPTETKRLSEDAVRRA